MEQIELEWEVELADGTPVIYDVSINLLSPGSAGYVSGPPEKCYPPEPSEAEIDSIKLQGLGNQPGIEMKPAIWESLGFTEKEINRIYERAWEVASDRAQGAYEDAMEAREEARREREWDERDRTD